MKLIHNVSLPAGNNFKTVNILFDEHIEQVSTARIVADNITEEYDLKGCIVMPGAIDMHTHILKGSDVDAANLKKITALALSGGYTTLADISYDTAKPLFRACDFEAMQTEIEANALCDIALWGNVDFGQFPYHIDHINELWAAGVTGLTIVNPSPNHLIESMSYNDVMDLFDDIYDSDISFSFQGFDWEALSDKDSIEGNFIDKRLSAIKKMLRRLQDNPLHLIGIWDRETVDVLNIAVRRADLSYSVPVLKLFPLINKLNTEAGRKDTVFLEFVKLLFDSMKNGKLYTISTEADSSFKDTSDINSIAFTGYDPGWLQWIVPWALSELWKRGRISIQSVIRMLSENPAKRLGIHPYKGTLEKGASADMIIIDPNLPVLSPLLDAEGNPMTLVCSIRHTFRAGQLYDPTETKTESGRLLKRFGSTRRRSSSHWN